MTKALDKALDRFAANRSLFPSLNAWSVGFDPEWRIFDELQSSFLGDSPAYPPYNIKKINENKNSRYGIMIINRFKDYEWDDILVGAQREDKVISTKKRI